MTDDPKIRRLRADYVQMVEINGRSDLIEVEPAEPRPGMPPEFYSVIYSCRGIASIDGDQQPVYADEHRTAVYLDANYPVAPPKVKVITPVWHPNIMHAEPKLVCIDNTWWTPARTLHSVVLMVGEMLQYKNYHAKATPPYPADPEVARWAVWAEGQGLIGPDKPVDGRPLQRPERVRLDSGETEPPAYLRRPETGGAPLVRVDGDGAEPADSGPEPERRIRVLPSDDEAPAAEAAEPSTGRIRVTD